MRILEARESFIKIESNEHIKLSTFLQIKDQNKSYIAQVIKVQKVNDKILAYAKLLYLYDGELKTYDGLVPQNDAEISLFSFDKLSSTFNIIEPILTGKFIENRENVFIDKMAFDKKTIISAETPEFFETVITNIKQELSKTSKVFVVDMQGVISSQKFVAGKDFRLPLNTDSLEFMYEDCLNDTTSDSKNLIKEIFKDLSDYSKTVPFLPFGALKSIVDDMVDKSHVFKLLVLKNKLNKFDKMGYFAVNQTDAENINKILAMNSAFIDLSKLDLIFQNRYLETIYNSLEDNSYVIVIASNNISKKNLKTILTKQNVASTFVTHPRFKYINEIKSMFKNYIIEPTFTNNEVFKAYSTFLNSMVSTTYLLTGECTNYLPLISIVEKNPEEVKLDKQIKEVVSQEFLEELAEIDSGEASDCYVEEIVIEKDEQTEAIDKKSNELIEKIAEDFNDKPQSGLSLFEDEQDDDDEVADAVEITEEVIEEAVSSDLEDDSKSLIEDFEENIEELEDCEDEQVVVLENVSQSNDDYHTMVDDIKAIDVPQDIVEMTDAVEIEEEVISSSTVDEISNEPLALDDVVDIQGDLSNDDVIEIPENITDDIVEDEDIISQEDTDVEITKLENVNEEKSFNEGLDVISINDEEPAFEEIIELDESELNDSEIIVELEDFDQMEVDESLDKEIIEDVDKVFTTIKDNSLSDNDLDLIDELNSENDAESFDELSELQSEDEELDFVEPIEEISDNSDFVAEKEVLETKKSMTSNVPVFDAEIPAEDTVQSDPIEQGDSVTHAKYGLGVVEKMIKYGNKTLFSINFDNVGRRLLDPTLTEIKKG